MSVSKCMVTATLVVATGLAGCESISTNELVGTVLGGASCAAISKLTGSSDRDAAIAAAVCATAGFAVTQRLESEREKYANNEAFYRAEISRMEAYDNQLKQEIDVSINQLAASQAQIDKASKKSEWTDVEIAELTRLNTDLAQRKAALNQELAQAKENLKYQQGVTMHMKQAKGSVDPRAQKQLAELSASVAQLEELVGVHEEQTAALGVYL